MRSIEGRSLGSNKKRLREEILQQAVVDADEYRKGKLKGRKIKSAPTALTDSFLRDAEEGARAARQGKKKKGVAVSNMPSAREASAQIHKEPGLLDPKKPTPAAQASAREWPGKRILTSAQEAALQAEIALAKEKMREVARKEHEKVERELAIRAGDVSKFPKLDREALRQQGVAVPPELPDTNVRAPAVRRRVSRRAAPSEGGRAIPEGGGKPEWLDDLMSKPGNEFMYPEGDPRRRRVDAREHVESAQSPMKAEPERAGTPSEQTPFKSFEDPGRPGHLARGGNHDSIPDTVRAIGRRIATMWQSIRRLREEAGPAEFSPVQRNVRTAETVQPVIEPTPVESAPTPASEPAQREDIESSPSESPRDSEGGIGREQTFSSVPSIASTKRGTPDVVRGPLVRGIFNKNRNPSRLETLLRTSLNDLRTRLRTRREAGAVASGGAEASPDIAPKNAPSVQERNDARKREWMQQVVDRLMSDPDDIVRYMNDVADDLIVKKQSEENALVVKKTLELLTELKQALGGTGEYKLEIEETPEAQSKVRRAIVAIDAALERVEVPETGPLGNVRRPWKNVDEEPPKS